MSTAQQVSTSEDPGQGSSSMISTADSTTNSRKRSREDDSEICCIGGCGNPHCNAKRNNADSSESQVRWWYIKLDSEDENYDSDTPSSLQEESVWSNQDNETEPIKDSDDDFSLSDDDETRWQASHHIEFELASDHSSDEEEGPFSKQRRANDSGSSTTCSSDLEAAAAVVAMVTSEALCEYFADSSSDSSDPELAPQDKWSCLKCKQKNQPIPRYCQHCFAVRKKWFPPRPRHRGQARRRGAARCQAERSQAEARRTSQSFPPPPFRTTNRNTRSPQPGTSRQDFPFVHPNSQPIPATLTPPHSFSSNSKSSVEASTSESIKFPSKIDDCNLVENVVTLDDIKEKVKDMEHSKAQSIPDTVILTNSEEDSESDNGDKSKAEFDNFLSEFSKNVDKALQAEKELQELKDKNVINKRSCENIKDEVDSIDIVKLPESVSNSSSMQCSQEINKCSTSISQSFLNQLEGLYAHSQNIEDSVNNSMQICEDVDGPKKSTQPAENVRKTTQQSEDVVDFPPKPTQSGEDVVDFPLKPTQSGEDVVDIPLKPKQSDEDVVDFPLKPTQSDEDVVDLPMKSHNKYIPSTSSQMSLDASVSFQKTATSSFFSCTSYQFSKDVDKPCKSNQNHQFPSTSQQLSEDIVDFVLNKITSSEDVIDSPRKSLQTSYLPCTSISMSDVNFLMKKKSTAKGTSVENLPQKYFIPCTSTQNTEDVTVGPLKQITSSEHITDCKIQSKNITTVLHQNPGASDLNIKKSDSVTNSNTSSLEMTTEISTSITSLKRHLDEDTVDNAKIQKTDSLDTNSFTSFCSTSPSSKPQSPIPENSTKLCIVCETKPADTAFTHGRFAHQCVCYQCAKKIYNSKGRCPICRRAASSFYKIYTI